MMGQQSIIFTSRSILYRNKGFHQCTNYVTSSFKVVHDVTAILATVSELIAFVFQLKHAFKTDW